MTPRAYVLRAPWPPVPIHLDAGALGLDDRAARDVGAAVGVVLRADGLADGEALWLDGAGWISSRTGSPVAGAGSRSRVVACSVAGLEALVRAARDAHPPLGATLAGALDALRRRAPSWDLPSGRFPLPGGARVVLMGILNVTPDSFSDGGRFMEPSAALDHALGLAARGAQIIDVGGESTRPGAAPVPVEEELRRVVPVVSALRRGLPAGVILSVDTMKAVVARAAVEAGAGIINDVSALGADPAMAETAAASGAGVILNHMRGTPMTMQEAPRYEGVLPEVISDLAAAMETAARAGIPPDRIAIDPGIGFGKRPADNEVLLRHLAALASFGRPVAVGVSRKSFLGRRSPDAGPTGEARADSTLAAESLAVASGAHILRTHDPERARRAALVAATHLSYHPEQDRC